MAAVREQATIGAVEPEWGQAEDLEEALVRLRKLVEADAVEQARAAAPGMLERWPDDPRVQKWNQVLALPTVRVVPRDPRNTWPEDRKWLRAHQHEYPGCWITVYGGRLVAAGATFQEVLDATRAAVGDCPAVVSYVPRDDE